MKTEPTADYKDIKPVSVMNFDPHAMTSMNPFLGHIPMTTPLTMNPLAYTSLAPLMFNASHSNPGLQTRIRDFVPDTEDNNHRTSVFSQVLDLFPDLRQRLIQSARPSLSSLAYNSLASVPDTVLFPVLTAEELDRVRAFPRAQVDEKSSRSLFPPSLEMTPHLTNLIDAYMDATPDVVGIISEYCDVERLSPEPSQQANSPRPQASPCYSQCSYSDSDGEPFSPPPPPAAHQSSTFSSSSSSSSSSSPPFNFESHYTSIAMTTGTSDSGAEMSPNDQDYPEDLTMKTLQGRSPKTSKKDNSGRVPCEICGKTFSTKANLKVHFRQHTGQKPFECTYCHKAFNQRSTLRTHVRIHTGEKPHQCSVCSRAFADYSTYTKHLRTHSGERPYTCPTCGKSFAQSGNMIRHQQTHKTSTPERPHNILPSILPQMGPLF